MGFWTSVKWVLKTLVTLSFLAIGWLTLKIKVSVYLAWLPFENTHSRKPNGEQNSPAQPARARDPSPANVPNLPAWWPFPQSPPNYEDKDLSGFKRRDMGGYLTVVHCQAALVAFQWLLDPHPTSPSPIWTHICSINLVLGHHKGAEGQQSIATSCHILYHLKRHSASKCRQTALFIHLYKCLSISLYLSLVQDYVVENLWRVLQDTAQTLIVQTWQLGTQDRIKARPHWDGLSDKEEEEDG